MAAVVVTLSGVEGQEVPQIAAAVGVNETFDRLIHAHVADLAYLTQSRGLRMRVCVSGPPSERGLYICLFFVWLMADGRQQKHFY